MVICFLLCVFYTCICCPAMKEWGRKTHASCLASVPSWRTDSLKELCREDTLLDHLLDNEDRYQVKKSAPSYTWLLQLTAVQCVGLDYPFN